MYDIKRVSRGPWLAQLLERVTLYLGVVSLSPTLGVEIPSKKKKKEYLVARCVKDGEGTSYLLQS